MVYAIAKQMRLSGQNTCSILNISIIIALEINKKFETI